MTSLTIGQVARRAEISVETIRYYERVGLIAPPKRRPSGYRAFSEGAVRRLRFIRRAKDLGFSLKEISELLELRFDSGGSCAEVRSRARMARLSSAGSAYVMAEASCWAPLTPQIRPSYTPLC